MPETVTFQSNMRNDTGHGRKWLTPFAGVVLWLGSVTLTTCIVGAAVSYLRTPRNPTASEIGGGVWGSQQAKLKFLHEVFDGQRKVLDDPDRQILQAFLIDVVKPAGDGETANWRSLLDENRFRDRILGSVWIRSMSPIDRFAMARRAIEEFSIYGPNQFTQVDIVRIVPWNSVVPKRAARADEMLVVAYAHHNYSSLEPALFWVVRSQGEWKLVDWCFTEDGMCGSETAGLFARADSENPVAGINTAFAQLKAADASEDKFESHLRAAESTNVPIIAADVIRYYAISRWSQHSRSDEVLRMAKQVADPDRIPAIRLLTATAYERTGEIDQALASLDQVERLLGFRPDVVQSRTRLLQRANRRDDAIRELQRAVDFDPSDPSRLGQLYRLLPKSRRNEVFERIAKHDHPSDLAMRFARSNSYQLTSAQLEDLSRIIKSAAPNSTEERDIEIMRLTKNRQLRAVAELQREAAEKETDPKRRLEFWDEYLQTMNTMGKLLDGFAQHPDPKAAFRSLFPSLEDDGYSTVAEDDRPAIFAAYRKIHPDDPWLSYNEGFYAAEARKFAEARQSFAAAERLLAAEAASQQTNATERDAAESDVSDEALLLNQLKSQLQTQLIQVRYELGEDLQILVDNGQDESTYHTLANMAAHRRHWSTLDKLNQSFASSKPNDAWLNRNQIRVLLAANDLDAVRKKLAAAKTGKIDPEFNLYLLDQIELELIDAEFPDPVEAFKHSKDRSEAFNRISRDLLQTHDWNSLDKLCALYAEGQAASPEIEFVRIEQAWTKSDYDALVKRLIPWPTATFAKRSYLESTWREHLIRCLIRLNRTEEAKQYAQDVMRQSDDLWPMIMACAALRDPERVSELLRDVDPLGEYTSYRDFAFDPELRPILVNQMFDQIRQQRDFVLPSYVILEPLILLLSRPVEMSESWLKERLGIPEGSGELETSVTSVAPSTLVVRWKGLRFLLTSAPDPFFNPAIVEGPDFRRHDAAKVPKDLFDGQRAYWQIACISTHSQSWDSSRTTVRELASRLWHDGLIGAAYLQSESGLVKVVSLNEAQMELLASHRFFRELDSNAVVVSEERRTNRLDPEQRQLLLSYAENQTVPMPPIRIQVRMSNASDSWVAPFRVLRVRYGQYRGCEAISEYAGSDECPGFPEIRPGVRWIIPIDRISSVEVSPP